MCWIQPTVHANAVDERVNEAAELEAQFLRVGIRVNLFAYVEPEDERTLKDLILLMGAAHQQQINRTQIAQGTVGLVDQIVWKRIA